MALWQLTLDPIPASSAQVAGIEAIQLTRSQLDAIALTLAESEQQQLFDEFSRLLPEKFARTEGMRIWGDESSHDIQVFTEAAQIEAIQIRLDVSKPAVDLISGLCEIARRRNWVFATRDGQIVQPTREAVVRAIMRSEANKFVSDPASYLEAAAKADSGHN